MDIFRPGKWLVLFCGVFVVLWGVLRFVSNQRLKEDAQAYAARIFTWSWPGANAWQSRVEITDSSVVQKTDHDAVVKVLGKQTLSYKPSDTASAQTVTETERCAAVLTLYRMSIKNKDYWVLGKVEFP